jgi:hypothetical protein
VAGLSVSVLFKFVFMQMGYNVVILFSSLREQRLKIIGEKRRRRSIIKELRSYLT